MANIGRRTAAPSSELIDALTTVASSALEASHILKGSQGNLYYLTVDIGAASGYLLLFDAAAVPADGAVLPVYAIPIASNGTLGYLTLDWTMPPVHFANGIVAVFSSTGPFTKTGSATAAFFAGVK